MLIGARLGRYNRFACPVLLDLLAEHGIEAQADLPNDLGGLAGVFGVTGDPRGRLVEVYVQADRLDEARRLAEVEFPARLRELQTSVAADPSFAPEGPEETLLDPHPWGAREPGRGPKPTVPFGWLEPAVARVLIEVLEEAEIRCEPEYPLDRPPPPFARPDGRVRMHVEELFVEDADGLLKTDVVRRLAERGIPFREPLRETDEP